MSLANIALSASRKNDYILRKFKKAQKLFIDQLQEEELSDRQIMCYEMMKMVCTLAMDKCDRLQAELNKREYEASIDKELDGTPFQRRKKKK